MGRGLFQRPARFQTSHHRQPPTGSGGETIVIASDDRFGADRQRHIERPPDLQSEEARGRDPDDFKRPVVQRELAANDVRVSAVLALPEAVTDDHARRAASTLIVRRGEDAAQRRPDAQHVEKISTHPERPRGAYLTALREVEAVRAPGEDAGKCLLSISDLLPDRIGYRRMRTAEISPRAGHIRDVYLGQLLWGFDRQRAQSHRVEQLKYSRVRPDAERQAEHGH